MVNRLTCTLGAGEIRDLGPAIPNGRSRAWREGDPARPLDLSGRLPVHVDRCSGGAGTDGVPGLDRVIAGGATLYHDTRNSAPR